MYELLNTVNYPHELRQLPSFLVIFGRVLLQRVIRRHKCVIGIANDRHQVRRYGIQGLGNLGCVVVVLVKDGPIREPLGREPGRKCRKIRTLRRFERL